MGRAGQGALNSRLEWALLMRRDCAELPPCCARTASQITQGKHPQHPHAQPRCRLSVHPCQSTTTARQRATHLHRGGGRHECASGTAATAAAGIAPAQMPGVACRTSCAEAGQRHYFLCACEGLRVYQLAALEEKKGRAWEADLAKHTKQDHPRAPPWHTLPLPFGPAHTRGASLLRRTHNLPRPYRRYRRYRLCTRLLLHGHHRRTNTTPPTAMDPPCTPSRCPAGFQPEPSASDDNSCHHT